MSYKIAAASSDHINIDLSFGAAQAFDIYEVEDGRYSLAERRIYNASDGCITEGCGNLGCGNGGAKGCGGEGNSPKVDMLSDCRFIICRKIGFNITKQLEKKAITGFDVDCTAEEALEKITDYYSRLDAHKSLRGFAKEDLRQDF